MSQVTRKPEVPFFGPLYNEMIVDQVKCFKMKGFYIYQNKFRVFCPGL